MSEQKSTRELNEETFLQALEELIDLKIAMLWGRTSLARPTAAEEDNCAVLWERAILKYPTPNGAGGEKR